MRLADSKESTSHFAFNLVRLQGDGDYEGTKAFFDRYAEARAVLASAAHIPVDIQPIYPSRV